MGQRDSDRSRSRSILLSRWWPRGRIQVWVVGVRQHGWWEAREWISLGGSLSRSHIRWEVRERITLGGSLSMSSSRSNTSRGLLLFLLEH